LHLCGIYFKLGFGGKLQANIHGCSLFRFGAWIVQFVFGKDLSMKCYGIVLYVGGDLIWEFVPPQFWDFFPNTKQSERKHTKQSKTNKAKQNRVNQNNQRSEQTNKQTNKQTNQANQTKQNKTSKPTKQKTTNQKSNKQATTNHNRRQRLRSNTLPASIASEEKATASLRIIKMK